jgi:hypothetical protein
MSTLTEDKLKGAIDDLLGPDGRMVERFLDKLDEPGTPVKLSNLQGVIRVIDRDYHSAAAGSFPGYGSFASDEYFEPVLADMQAGKEIQMYLSGRVGRLRDARPDLVGRHPILFS